MKRATESQLAALPERWMLHADNLRARKRHTKRDIHYVEGYTDALDDCAAWISKILYEGQRR